MKIYNCETEDSWLESNVSDLMLSFKENQDVPLRILSIGSGSGTDTGLFVLMMGRGGVKIRLSSFNQIKKLFMRYLPLFLNF